MDTFFGFFYNLISVLGLPSIEFPGENHSSVEKQKNILKIQLKRPVKLN